MRNKVIQLLTSAVDMNEDELQSVLETPPARDKGDVAFPCFQLAKTMRKSPIDIAHQLQEDLSAQQLRSFGIDRIEAMGPYLNFFFDRPYITKMLVDSTPEEQLRDHQVGTGQTVVVEYSSPNIAKHFKLYHIRSTMIGQALANAYEALGYQVEKMNHLGDWGTQFGKLMAAYINWGEEEKVKADPINELVKLYVRFHEEAAQKPALEEEGRSWFKKLEDGDTRALRLWEWFKAESLKEFDRIYDLLHVKFDHVLGESFYGEKMETVTRELEEKGLLEESEGAQVVRLDELDIPPCIIKKKDGTTIYATRDIAAALYRYEQFDPQKLIYVVDQRQTLHFQQVFSVLKKMGYDFADHCHHISFGIMKVDGEIGSTRQGKGVLLQDVLQQAIEKARGIIEEKNPSLHAKQETAEAIGTGAIIFNDLKHHRQHEVDFKWDEAFNFEGKTGPYVQYTHARIRSLLRRAEQDSIKPTEHHLYTQDNIWDLTFALGQYPQVLLETIRKDDPAQVAGYLLDLCQLFNRFYAQERMFVEDDQETMAKLALCRKVAQTLKHGLGILTIQAPEQI